ncbi:MAG: hypothetical protein WA210_10640 [Burkholderiaceae bacterium]
MAQPYLNALEQLVASELADVPGLVCKHFFSGAALTSKDKICASLTSAGVAFKLPQQRCSELIESAQASSYSQTRVSSARLPSRCRAGLND